ncbi:MAG: hypothetical protein Q9220_004906 [cf. Caloplaca sp. 1 TL-2023]
MATAAHCLFCFEVLAASLEKRESLSLRQVEDLWAQYEACNEEGLQDQPDNSVQDPDVQHGDEIIPDSDNEQDEHLADGPPVAPSEPTTQQSTLRPPTISRLQAPSSASASTSSTPSSFSASSSRLALDDSSSKTSSKSSFFSFGHRSEQPSPLKEERYPLFVTWNTISARGHKALRGCIGTFEPQDLSSGLQSYALTAAFDDTRFAPINSAELSSLATHITLLHSFTPCAHPLDWNLGTHGLRLSFTHHSRRLGATYLPDVAVEQGWSKEETVISLMRKAGWTGRSRDWRNVGDLRAVRYEGKGEGCGWRAWRDWRDWVDALNIDEKAQE